MAAPNAPRTREEMLAKVQRVQGSREFRAAAAARRAVVAKSAPREGWKPKVGEEIFVSLHDFDIVADPKTKAGSVMKGATKYTFRFRINDPSSRDNGKTFLIYYTLWAPSAKDKRDDSIEASRIRRLLEAASRDEAGNPIPCDSEAEWPEILMDIWEGGLVFRAKFGEYPKKNGNTEEYITIIEEVAPASDASIAHDDAGLVDADDADADAANAPDAEYPDGEGDPGPEPETPVAAPAPTRARAPRARR